MPKKPVMPSQSAIAAFYPRIAPPAFAVYLIACLQMRSFFDPWLLVGWTALALGFIAAPKSTGHRKTLAALAGLLAAHAVAIPGAIIWGSGNWVLTAGVLIWMAPSMALYIADNTDRVLAWLIPAWLAHAGLIIWGGFFQWALDSRGHILNHGIPTGLANNANLAAGFLDLGIVYALISNRPWMAPPLIMALLFTGSRWGIAVAGAVIILMVITRTISWRPVMWAALTLIGAVWLIGAATPAAYTIAGYDSLASIIYTAQADVGTRLAVPHIPSFLPRGVAEHSGLHNVPLRIAVESGIGGALLWVAITAWALGRRSSDQHGHINQRRNAQQHPRHHVRHRWLLITLVLLGILDYYTWMGHMGGFWWLLIGMVKGGGSSEDERILPSTGPGRL